jgi:hypothetical protein
MDIPDGQKDSGIPPKSCEGAVYWDEHRVISACVQHAQEAGLHTVIEKADELILALVDEGQWHFTPTKDGSVDFVFNHPAFEHTEWGRLSALEKTLHEGPNGKCDSGAHVFHERQAT